MTLSKRYHRNIKANLSFYVAASVLTIVTLLLFYMWNIAGHAIINYGKDFMARNNI